MVFGTLEWMALPREPGEPLMGGRNGYSDMATLEEGLYVLIVVI